MIERLHSYTAGVPGIDGRTYTTHVLGRQRDDGTWEGTLFFEPTDQATPLESDAETTQPNRDALIYWATGLEDTFLEGALRRAERKRDSGVRQTPANQAAPLAPPFRTVLNPFEVYQQGETILRDELGALSAGHLQNIIRAYGLGSTASATASVNRDPLVEQILASVRARMSVR
jgi:hypothetical protein